MVTEQILDLGAIEQLIIAGWTGRNIEALEAHIRELEAIGVKRPKSVPVFYRVSASLLTQADAIQVMGGDSSGEIEFVLYMLPDGLWIGIGSDHTDRRAETVGVTLSKQMCAKPVSRKIWRYDEIAPHWDQLLLRSFIRLGKERVIYQEGSVAAMRRPDELMALYGDGKKLAVGTAMFGGTLAVHGGIKTADIFEMEIEDPVLGRTISHRYRIVSLPNEG